MSPNFCWLPRPDLGGLQSEIFSQEDVCMQYRLSKEVMLLCTKRPSTTASKLLGFGGIQYRAIIQLNYIFLLQYSSLVLFKDSTFSELCDITLVATVPTQSAHLTMQCACSSPSGNNLTRNRGQEPSYSHVHNESCQLVDFYHKTVFFYICTSFY